MNLPQPGLKPQIIGQVGLGNINYFDKSIIQPFPQMMNPVDINNLFRPNIVPQRMGKSCGLMPPQGIINPGGLMPPPGPMGLQKFGHPPRFAPDLKLNQGFNLTQPIGGYKQVMPLKLNQSKCPVISINFS